MALAVTAGCGQVVSVWGDSQTHNGTANITSQYSDPTVVDVRARPGCGLYGNPICPIPDWAPVVTAARSSYAQSNTPVACFVVHLGLNDALWKTDLTSRNYALMLDRFLNLFPSTDKIVWLNEPYAQSPTLPGLDARLQFLNGEVLKAASRFPNLTVWDLRAHFIGHFPAWYAADGFHFNQHGLVAYAAQVRAATDSVGCS